MIFLLVNVVLEATRSSHNFPTGVYLLYLITYVGLLFCSLVNIQDSSRIFVTTCACTRGKVIGSVIVVAIVVTFNNKKKSPYLYTLSTTDLLNLVKNWPPCASNQVARSQIVYFCWSS